VAQAPRVRGRTAKSPDGWHRAWSARLLVWGTGARPFGPNLLSLATPSGARTRSVLRRWSNSVTPGSNPDQRGRCCLWC
jgi:hypothetical protein